MDIEQPSQKNTYAVVLAGGSSTRMGRPHKGLMAFGSNTILHRIIQNIQPQVAHVLLNINADEELYTPYISSYGLTTINDDNIPNEGNLGPLAGICSAMTKIKQMDSDAKWLLSVPCDGPYLPINLLVELASQITKDNIQTLSSTDTQEQLALVVNPCSNGRKHHVIGVWSLDLEEPLRRFLASGQRAVGKFLQSINNISVAFDIGENDPFFNVNTPADYQTAIDKNNIEKMTS